MRASIEQLKKLRGKSVGEIRERGRQELAKLGERVFGFSTGEMSDARLYAEIGPAQRNGTGKGTALYIAERIQASIAASRHSSHHLFFPSLGYRKEIVELMEGRFAAERADLIERAERAVRGKFDLLGMNDLSFGDPIDWRLEPVSGKRTPLDHWSKIDYLNPSHAGDKKVTWELNRHQYFVTLGQAYWLTQDERFAIAFVSQASAWMDANPPKQGINWASSLELSFRAISWLWALHLLAGSPHLTPEFIARLLKCLLVHGRHIEGYLSKYFSPNTHLTGEALGLFYLGTALPELGRARSWRRLGLRILLEQLNAQVRPDGVYFEQASYYHRYTADFYTHLLVLGRATGAELPLEVEAWLEKLLDHLMWITRPDGDSPFIGDDDGGRLVMLGGRRSRDFRDTLAVGAAIRGRGDWKFVAGDAPVEMLWLLGPEAVSRYDAVKAAAPRDHSRAFGDSGYFVMRDGWSPEFGYALIDCGPHGAKGCGHAHADALSFEFAAQGRTWLVDPGTFTYTSDLDERNWFRTTEAHNTATVDGEPQSVPAGAFSWSTAAGATAHSFIDGELFAYFEGSHDGYERLADPVVHSRSILFIKAAAEAGAPSYLVLSDRFTARERHLYAMRYHFDPRCAALASGNRALVTGNGEKRLSIQVFGLSEPEARIEHGWVSSCYGQRESAPVAVMEASGEGDQHFLTFIVPSLGKRHAPHIEMVGAGPSACFTVTAGDALDVVAAGGVTSDLANAPLVAGGSLAWARLVGGRMAAACLFGGNLLKAGGVTFRSDERVEHVAIRREASRGEVRLSISGASRFELELDDAKAGVSINGTSFEQLPETESVAFVREESGWRMIEPRKAGY